jgi:hypothetical protein
MPVRIHEFDVAVEPQPCPEEQTAQPASPPQSSTSTSRPLSVEAVERLTQQMYERRQRTWAD